MTAFAIVGAGRGLGVSGAGRFGQQGFDIVLLAGCQEHVDELAAQLMTEGITARGHAGCS